MAYTAKVYADDAAGATPITAAKLNSTEAGIAAAASVADAAETPAGAQAKATAAAAVDATTTAKGRVQLAGDLGGTSALPTVPGLAGKAATTDPRFTDTRVPTDASVTDAKVAAAAAISLDKTADSASRLAFLPAERTKLTGVATGATANSTDAVLLARANHTGTQGAGTITGLATVATSGLKADVGLGNVDNTSDASKPVSAAQAAADALKADKVITTTTQIGTAYTLALADAATMVESNNAAAVTITIPANATAAFPVGSVIGLRQYGAGQVTVAPAAGVTIRSRGGALKIAGQYGEASLAKRGVDEWIIVGDVVV